MKSKFTKSSFYSILIALSFLLVSCSSTSLVDRWNDPEYKGPALQKILVIGIIKDDIKRRSFEQEFSDLMTGNGLVGVASYTLLPDLESADEKSEVLAAVNKVGADGVLVVTLQGVSKEKRDVPPSVDYIPTAGFGYGGMYGYYGMRHTAVYRPGYTVTDTVVRMDVKMFAVDSEKMIWAGKSESFNASSSKAIVSELEKLVISDMKKSGIIK